MLEGTFDNQKLSFYLDDPSLWLTSLSASFHRPPGIRSSRAIMAVHHPASFFR